MTSAQTNAADPDVLGPISYLVVEFPGGTMTGQTFPLLLDLVDRGIIRILDLQFVGRSEDGSIYAIELGDIDHDGQFDFAVFAGVSSGLLGQSDLEDAASAISKSSAAAVMIFENHWAGPFVQSLRNSGAELVAAGYIPQDDLVASLEAMGG